MKLYHTEYWKTSFDHGRLFISCLKNLFAIWVLKTCYYWNFAIMPEKDKDKYGLKFTISEEDLLHKKGYQMQKKIGQGGFAKVQKYEKSII